MFIRYLKNQIEKDLMQKMVFLAGPRQVGKTTLAKTIIDNETGYLNWDIAEHRERILLRELPPSDFYVFDEIHKFSGWRDFLKGLYDSFLNTKKILVTGSGRLDYYRYSGDSLQGRYHFLRMHPLSVAELRISSPTDLNDLFILGGFPEPFFTGSEVEARRWSREYRNLIVNEEVSSLESVRDLDKIELLMMRLPQMVGAPLSVNSLTGDLQTSHKTVSKWLSILERLYVLIRIPPFGSPLIRAVKKEQKHYHFDWTIVKERGKKFENFIAMHLHKWVQFQQDTKGRDMELRYFRDIDGREVDFVILEDLKPIELIEVKTKDEPISKNLHYLKRKFSTAHAYQISLEGEKDYETPEGIRVQNCLHFLQERI